MIYLDHNATTPVRPGVVAAMTPYWDQRAGNPSSVHGIGRAARLGLDQARRGVATTLGVHDSQVIFTSGATESNHLAMLGLAAKRNWQGRVITSPVEHPSILALAESLAKQGLEWIRLPVDGAGQVNPDDLRQALTSDTVMVSIMFANNETGVIQPIPAIAAICREAGIPCHCDAVQGFGRLPITMPDLGVDLLSLSGHKFGGPKGIGALVVDSRIALEPMLIGGGQERGRRAGTENLPGAVGMAAAIQAITVAGEAERQRLTAMRQRLESALQESIPSAILFGQEAERLPNTVAFAIPGLEGETLVMNLDLEGFAISSGSACSSGRTQASHVLRAMGIGDDLGRGLVRVSLGWSNQEEDGDRFLAALRRTVVRLQAMGVAIPGNF